MSPFWLLIKKREIQCIEHTGIKIVFSVFEHNASWELANRFSRTRPVRLENCMNSFSLCVCICLCFRDVMMMTKHPGATATALLIIKCKMSVNYGWFLSKNKHTQLRLKRSVNAHAVSILCCICFA